MMARAVASCDRGLVDHVDLNFGCPAAKVTRRGGEPPCRPSRRCWAIVRAAVRRQRRTASRHRQVPHGPLRRPAHARVPEPCARTRGSPTSPCTPAPPSSTTPATPAGTRRRAQGSRHVDPRARQRRHLGRRRRPGDDASDRLRRVVVGRGCLGRPWLFGDLLAVFAGRPAPPPPLGDVVDVMAAHAIDLVEHLGSERTAMRDFRKHTAWYLTGYPVGPEARRRLAMVSSLVELDDLLAGLDRGLAGPRRRAIRRGTPTGRSGRPARRLLRRRACRARRRRRLALSGG